MDRRASPSMKVSDAGFRQVALLSRCGVRTCRVLHSPMPCVPNCSSSPRCRAIGCASSRIGIDRGVYERAVGAHFFYGVPKVRKYRGMDEYGGCVDETTASLGAYEAAPKVIERRLLTLAQSLDPVSGLRRPWWRSIRCPFWRHILLPGKIFSHTRLIVSSLVGFRVTLRFAPQIPLSCPAGSPVHRRKSCIRVCQARSLRRSHVWLLAYSTPVERIDRTGTHGLLPLWIKCL